MKAQLLASLAFAALAASGAAKAADIGQQMPSPYNWTGLYVGVNGGGGWGNSDHNFATGTSTGTFNIKGGMAGGGAGFNWQAGQFVAGVETDLDWADLNGSTSCPNVRFACGTNDSWLGSTRARVGWAPNSLLFYCSMSPAVRLMAI
jgi:outer membrane immunogenic protein